MTVDFKTVLDGADHLVVGRFRSRRVDHERVWKLAESVLHPLGNTDEILALKAGGIFPLGLGRKAEGLAGGLVEFRDELVHLSPGNHVYRQGRILDSGLEPMTAVQRACETGVAVITNPSRATGWMVLPETFCLLSCDRPMVKYPEGTLTMSKVTSETV